MPMSDVLNKEFQKTEAISGEVITLTTTLAMESVAFRSNEQKKTADWAAVFEIL